MQRLLALQWSPSEASAVVAVLRAGRMRIEQAWSIDLHSAAGDADPLDGSSQRLTAALKAKRLGRIPTVVALGRSRVELRHLTLPAAPDDELPDLVRFQALRQFNNLEEHWPLDFIPLPTEGDQERYVLAAAVSPELLDEIRGVCDKAGLKLAHLVLQPCATGSLAARRLGPRANGTRLLVNVAGGEADLAVIVDGRVSFLRQAHLDGDPFTDPAFMPALLLELRRTIAAVQNQPGSRNVDGCVLLATGDRPAAAAKIIAAELSLPTDLADPYEGVDWRGTADEQLQNDSGRWAPLVGALWDEATTTEPVLDFLHPRQRPEPPSRRNTYALAGLAAALLVLAVIVMGWLRSEGLLAELRSLQRQSTALDDGVKKAEQSEKSAQEVRQWLAGQVNWLDQLRWLSEHMPPAQDAMLTGLKLSATAQRGEMTLDGVARDVDAAAQLGRGLQDASHRVDPKTTDKTAAKPPYGVQFRSSLLIGKESK